MKKTLLALTILGTLSACGGGGGGSSAGIGPLTPLVGQLVDGPVANVTYETSSGLRGTTNASGNYAYRGGDTVKFSIGKVILGEGLAGPITTPIDLVSGAIALDHPNVVKILQVLQTLDDDLDPANGINISAAVVSRLSALPAETNIKDLSDLTASVINPAFASGAPALKTAAVAKLHFAETLSALESAGQFARLPGVSNLVIGGGNRNCSSFNGDTKSSNCAADWTTIVAQDAAFAGLTKANISFDSTYVTPEFKFSLTQANADKLAALPASLMDAGRKSTLIAAVNGRIAGTGPKAALSFSDFDGSKPLFADGTALWNTALSGADFDLLVATMCSVASPANGADCVLSNANVSAVQSAAFASTANRAQVGVILRNLQAAFGTGAIKYRRDVSGATASPNFRAEFQARKLAADGSAVTAGLTANLTAPEKAVLRSLFVDANPQTNRKIEARSVKFLSDTASLDIYTQFVAAAQAANGGRKPSIGVVTAATENAFFDRDINVMALRSAGADVVFLPLDGGFRKALDANDCSNAKYYYDSYANTNASGDYYNMDQVYPDLAAQQQAFCAGNGSTLATTLQNLNGIYFGGGDQARHLESLVSKDASGNYTVISPQLAILKARFDAGQLVVAGTSAGDHIQGGGVWKGRTVPMIGGGDSYTALKSGFAKGNGPVVASDLSPISYAQGGLGFFKYGVLDSHFSRRAREGRLVRQTRETGMDYGFGVDENTALVVGKPDAAGKTSFTVTGAAGVFIVDVRSATASGSPTGNYTIDGVRAHYLTPGDTAEIDAAGNLSVTLSATKPLLPVVAGQPTVVQKQVLDYGAANFLAMAKAVGVNGAALGFGSTEGSADGRGDPQNGPFYSATLSRNAGTVFKGLSNGRVSYTQAILKLAPCTGACVAP